MHSENFPVWEMAPQQAPQHHSLWHHDNSKLWNYGDKYSAFLAFFRISSPLTAVVNALRQHFEIPA